MSKIGKWLLVKLKQLLAWVWGLVMKFIAVSLERKLIAIIGMAFGVWLTADQLGHMGGSTTNNYKEEIAQLGDGLTRSLTEGFREMKDFNQSMMNKLALLGKERESLLRRIDSLEKLNMKLVMLSTGQGLVEVKGAGEAKSGHFEDNWLKADYTPTSMQYEFRFTLHEVTAEFLTQDNKRTEIYKVYLRSLVDPNDIRTLGDYKRDRSVLIEPIADTRTWYWDDLAINADFIYNGQNLEGAISLSLWSWTAGGLTDNQVIARLPDVGASTNLKDSHHLFVGLRLNIAHWLGLFRDLYIAPKYAIDHNGHTGFLIGLGTTL
jgi:hypothetical protein